MVELSRNCGHGESTALSHDELDPRAVLSQPEPRDGSLPRLREQGRDVDAWVELRGGILLGSDEFVAKLKPLLSDYEALRELPRRERLATRPSLEEHFSGVRDKKERNRQIYAATRVHEYTLQAVADFVGLHYSTVSMIAKRMDEEGRHQK